MASANHKGCRVTKVKRTFRIDKKLSAELDERNKRNGDFTVMVEEALRMYFESRKEVPPVPSVVAKVEPKAKPKYEPYDFEFSQWAWAELNRDYPDMNPPNLESWAKDVRLMRTKDNRTPDQLAFMWSWARKDEFWQSNILSMSKFRKQFDKLVAKAKSNEVKDKNDVFSSDAGTSRSPFHQPYGNTPGVAVVGGNESPSLGNGIQRATIGHDD